MHNETIPPSDAQERAALLSPQRRALLEKWQRGRAASALPLARIPRRSGSEIIPLSFQQQRLWFLDQLQAGTPFYTGALPLHIEGQLRIDLLTESLTLLLARHESLRTRFPTHDDGSPYQQIDPAAPLPLPVVDLQGVTSARQQSALLAILQVMQHSLRLADGPLLRACLLRWQPRTHLLLLVLHHIIVDGLSLQVLRRELAALYSALLNPTPSPALPTPPLQYADYALWQQQWLAGSQMQEQLQYWRQELQGAPVLLELPTDHSRPALQSHRGALLRRTIPPALAGALKRCSQQEGVTLFMTTLAAWQILLARYSGQNDLVVGTPIANRTRPELASLVGFFANTLALRADLSGRPTLRQYLQQVRTRALAAYAHQELPFERLVEVLQVPRSLSHNPLFQVMFSLDELTLLTPDMGDLQVQLRPLPNAVAQFDLSLSLGESEQGMQLVLHYSTDLFEAASMTRLLGHYLNLLAAIVHDLEQPIDTLPLLTGAEQALWQQGTDEAQATPGTLSTLLCARAADAPDAVALVDGDHQLTAGACQARANRLARTLRRRGVGPECLVALCLARSSELLVSLLGVLKAGGAYLLLDPTYPATRLSYLLADSQACLVLVRQALPTGVEAGQATLLDLAQLDLAEVESQEEPLCGVAPANLAYVVYTSGSSGQPRGVMISQAALLSHSATIVRRFALHPGDRVLQYASPGFDVAGEEIFPTWLAGACLVLGAQPLPTGELNTLLWQQGLSVLNLPTSYWQRWSSELAETGQGLPATLRLLITGSESASGAQLVRWRTHAGSQITWLHAYGVSEATITSTLYQPTEEAGATWATIPIGHPLEHTRAYLLDRALQPVPPGVVAELYLGGATLARGYLRRPALSAERFLPHPFASTPGARLYRTGDRARRRADGTLEFLGRSDTQINLHGYRIEPGEIEARLREHSAVQEAVVQAWRLPGGEQQLVAYIQPRAARGCTEQELHEFLRTRLPAYLLPGRYCLLATLPLTPGGKIDRAALAPLPLPEAQAGDGAPRTILEELLVEIWAELLACAQVSIFASFFALGGHSLLATRLIARVRETLQIDLPLQSIFAAPTIAQLAQVIAHRQGRPDEAGELAQLPALIPDPARRYQPFPLSEVLQAYWIGQNAAFELGNVSTHAYLEIEHRGLDLARLTLAWQALVARHDLLRAIIEGQGQMRILRPGEITPYQIAQCDLRGLDERASERHLEQMRLRLSHQILPTDRWPQFALLATRLDNEVWLLHLSLGPLTGDGSSWAILDRELARLYADPQATLPPLDLSYRDYVLAELQLRHTGRYRRAQDYWQQRLPTLPAAPQLPLACHPGELRTPRFVRRSLRLPAQAWQGLKGHAARLGLTPSVAVLAAFAALLARWGKSARFTINLTVFNRLPLHPQVSDLVGDFTSLTLLEVDLSRVQAFYAQARQLQQQLWADLEQRAFDGVQVLRELARRQGAALAARMPIVFTSTLGSPLRERAAPRFIGGNIRYSITQTPQVWLDNQVMESQGALTIHWDAVEELFPAGLLDAMFTSYHDLLIRLAESKKSWEDPAACRLPPAQLALQRQFNQTAGPPGHGLLFSAFLARARQQPDAPAVIAPGQSLSYQQLLRRASQVAHLLHARGAAPNTLVAIVMDCGWEQVVAALGILLAGAAYLPIDADLPEARLTHHLQHGEVSLVLTQSWLRERIPWPRGVELLSLDTLEPGAEEVTLPACGAQPTDLAYVIYTSGSTGQPKGVMIEHASALNTIQDINERFGVGPGDRVLALAALNFDLSVYDLFGMLAAGAALVLPEARARQDPAHWATLLRQEQISIWNTVPALLELLVDYLAPQALPSDLRLALLSGDWIPLTLPERVGRLAPRLHLISLGGATEGSIWSILYPVAQIERTWKSIPYGRPMRNQRFYVLNERGEACPTSVPGQLYIAGAGLARGYWRDPLRTAASFVPHPTTGERLYRTGDLGSLQPDGTLEFLGRADFQVKIQGYRIEPGEIEATLTRLPAVGAAVVVARAPRQGNRHLLAYVVPAAGYTLTAGEVRAFLQPRLPAYMLPAQIVLLPRLPLSPNGKIDRHALPDPDPAAVPAGVDTPAHTLTGRLTHLVASLLQAEHLEAGQNLLELGANSIDMLRILNLVEKELHFRPALAEFFRQPSIEYLATVGGRQVPAPVPAAGNAAAAAFPLLRDPAAQEAWKLQHLELRQDTQQYPLTPLPTHTTEAQIYARYQARRSQRRFLAHPLPLARLSTLLECLRPLSIAGEQRRLYPSAGALYPIQVYLYLKAGRIEDLEGGIYYYHPPRHQLVSLARGVTLDATLYEPLVNQPIFTAAAFSLFLIAQPAAIAPLYGPAAHDFCLLEAGYMSQLLLQSAASCQIGLCPIGGLDFARIERFFALEAHQFLVHSLLGGAECEEGEL
jgi:amino acid adenylation domain-containing protein